MQPKLLWGIALAGTLATALPQPVSLQQRKGNFPDANQRHESTSLALTYTPNVSECSSEYKLYCDYSGHVCICALREESGAGNDTDATLSARAIPPAGTVTRKMNGACDTHVEHMVCESMATGSDCMCVRKSDGCAGGTVEVCDTRQFKTPCSCVVPEKAASPTGECGEGLLTLCDKNMGNCQCVKKNFKRGPDREDQVQAEIKQKFEDMVEAEREKSSNHSQNTTLATIKDDLWPHGIDDDAHPFCPFGTAFSCDNSTCGCHDPSQSSIENEAVTLETLATYAEIRQREFHGYPLCPKGATVQCHLELGGGCDCRDTSKVKRADEMHRLALLVEEWFIRPLFGDGEPIGTFPYGGGAENSPPPQPITVKKPHKPKTPEQARRRDHKYQVQFLDCVRRKDLEKCKAEWQTYTDQKNAFAKCVDLKGWGPCWKAYIERLKVCAVTHGHDWCKENLYAARTFKDNGVYTKVCGEVPNLIDCFSGNLLPPDQQTQQVKDGSGPLPYFMQHVSFIEALENKKSEDARISNEIKQEKAKHKYENRPGQDNPDYNPKYYEQHPDMKPPMIEKRSGSDRYVELDPLRRIGHPHFPPPKRSIGEDYDETFPPPKRSIGEDYDEIFPPPKRSIGEDYDETFPPPKRSIGDALHEPSKRVYHQRLRGHKPPPSPPFVWNRTKRPQSLDEEEV